MQVGFWLLLALVVITTPSIVGAEAAPSVDQLVRQFGARVFKDAFAGRALTVSKWTNLIDERTTNIHYELSLPQSGSSETTKSVLWEIQEEVQDAWGPRIRLAFGFSIDYFWFIAGPASYVRERLTRELRFHDRYVQQFLATRCSGSAVRGERGVGLEFGLVVAIGEMAENEEMHCLRKAFFHALGFVGEACHYR